MAGRAGILLDVNICDVNIKTKCMVIVHTCVLELKISSFLRTIPVIG